MRSAVRGGAALSLLVDIVGRLSQSAGSIRKRWPALLVVAMVGAALLPGRSDGADPLGLASLRNAEYASEWTASRRVRLRDGHYREPAAPGSATEIQVSLLDRTTAWTAGGRRHAAVILVTDPGGSGTFHDLAVVEERRGRPVEVASAGLGDRVRVESLTVARRDGRTELHVGLVAHGPEDARCCPTRRMVRAFVWNGRTLVPRAAE